MICWQWNKPTVLLIIYRDSHCVFYPMQATMCNTHQLAFGKKENVECSLHRANFVITETHIDAFC